MKEKFLSIFAESFAKGTFSKLSISSPSKAFFASTELKAIYIKPYTAKDGLKLSWVYRYARKDITKNFTISESVEHLDKMIGVEFLQADLFCTDKEYFLKSGKKPKLSKKKPSEQRVVESTHDKTKQRIVGENAEFLKTLGVTSADGFLKKDKRDKYIQINKFLEFFAVASQSLSSPIEVLDMGSGKGYLTFAMYDYLVNNKKLDAQVRGVEFRQDMVDLCNQYAKETNFSGLDFVKGTIEDYKISNIEVLIALHACDTATDDAIFKGITANAQLIMVSPCCHKQVRKAMKVSGVSTVFSKFGIIEERTAEMLTDIIRAQILEIYGYETNIFEFINSAHTPKNLMITAVKKRNAQPQNEQWWNDVATLKQQFGVTKHYLEDLLRNRDLAESL